MSASANAASAVPIGRYGMPRHPDELATHRCILDANNPDPNRWPFLIDGEWVRIPIKGPLVSNSPSARLPASDARGQGNLICPNVFLGDDLAQGRLVQFPPDFSSGTIAIQAVQLPSAFDRPKVSASIEILKRHID